ncbi:MAG TPA: peptidoglycan DD-metalloendopeptidase family protein [Burkholderiales bacterium]
MALLTAVVAVAVIGSMPGAPYADAAPAPSRLEEELRLAVWPAPAPATYLREERFQRGDTLGGFLARLGVADGHIARLARLPAMRQLRPGSTVDAELSADGLPLSLRFLAERDRLIEISAEGDALRTADRPAALDTRVAMRSGVIRTSLFAAADTAGIPDSVAIQLADVFAGDIDFYRDLRQGDRFAVVYETHSLAGRPVRAGRVVAAEFVNQKRSFRAVRYGAGYYGPDGGNLRKAFLRAPLEFSRISSGFGGRVHPMFRTWSAHQGVDYAAPAGTRVRAVGDGVVEFAGERGGYGMVAVLRHRGSYSTVYAHLRGFAAGVRRGARLAQGDSVGFVGQSGWATGPHLHYEFRVAGVARNPRSIALPAGEPVPARELEAFRQQTAPLLSQLQLIAASPIAFLE